MKNRSFIFLFVLLVISGVIVTCFPSKTLQLGIDVLEKDNFKLLADAGKIGVLTHLASTNSDNVPTCDIFIKANKDKSKLNGRLVCFFSPEHGFRGKKEAGENVDNEIYEGVSVKSLYDGDHSRIKEDSFKDIDSLVIDLRDIGVRYYCYNTCMRFALEKAIKEGKKVYILDRPNPLGRKISGFCLEEKLQAYVGGFCIPHVYGMTMGELANMTLKNYIPHPWLPSLTKEDLKNGKSLLTVIKMKNWVPEKTWVEQSLKKGFRWHAPSPNIPCFESAKAYSCSIAVLSYGNFTTKMHDAESDACIDNIWIQPFVLLKLPSDKFPNADALKNICKQLNELNLAGISFFVNKEAVGIDLKIEDWKTFDPFSFVLHALYLDQQIDKTLHARNNSYWQVTRSILGNESLIKSLYQDGLTKDKINAFLDLSQKQCKEFEIKRKNWLLY